MEIDPSCRDETIIRKAYLAKVKQYHPDSSTHDSQLGHTKFNEIQQAYEALTVNWKYSSQKNIMLSFCSKGIIENW